MIPPSSLESLESSSKLNGLDGQRSFGGMPSTFGVEPSEDLMASGQLRNGIILHKDMLGQALPQTRLWLFPLSLIFHQVLDM